MHPYPHYITKIISKRVRNKARHIKAPFHDEMVYNIQLIRMERMGLLSRTCGKQFLYMVNLEPKIKYYAHGQCYEDSYRDIKCLLPFHGD